MDTKKTKKIKPMDDVSFMFKTIKRACYIVGAFGSDFVMTIVESKNVNDSQVDECPVFIKGIIEDGKDDKPVGDIHIYGNGYISVFFDNASFEISPEADVEEIKW